MAGGVDKRTELARKGNKVSESTLRRRFNLDLITLGLHGTDIEHRSRKGIPDYYIEGGNWIEFKFFPTATARGLGLNVTNFFRPSQKVWLGRRPTHDRKFVGFLFVNTKMEARVVILRFLTLYDFDKNHHRWTMGKAKEFGVDFWDDAARLAYIGNIFGSQYDRCSNWDYPPLQLLERP